MQMIEKEELLELLGDAEQDSKLEDECEAQTIKKCIRLVKGMKAVEVVRCKDCKQYNGHRYCTYFAETVLDNDVCSYGERKDND